MKTLKVLKLNANAVLPRYALEGDAGLDLFASEKSEIPPMSRALVPTGVAMEIPQGFVGLVWDKSGLAAKSGVKTMAGVVDSCYRGEVKVALMNFSRKKVSFNAGDKIAQMLIQKIEIVRVREAVKLTDTSRGKGGFGSTGK